MLKGEGHVIFFYRFFCWEMRRIRAFPTSIRYQHQWRHFLNALSFPGGLTSLISAVQRVLEVWICGNAFWEILTGRGREGWTHIMNEWSVNALDQALGLRSRPPDWALTGFVTMHSPAEIHDLSACNVQCNPASRSVCCYGRFLSRRPFYSVM